MSNVKQLASILGLACLITLGVIVASAQAALPDLHVNLSQAYPVSAQADATAVNVVIATPGGTVLQGTSFAMALTWTALSSAATWTWTLANVVKGVKKCKTAGDAAGTVLLSGTADMVFVELTPSLKIAPLFLVSKTKIECEGLNVTIEGDVLGTYNGTLNADITEFKGALLGENGKQALTKFENAEGATVEAVLLSEAGAGFAKTSVSVAKESTLKSNKMIELLG